MTTMGAFLKQHPVLSYYILTFSISWLSALVVFGPGVFLGTTQVAFVGLGPLAYVAFVAGPAVAGIVSTVLRYERDGLRDLRMRWCRWQVGVGWYAFALLTAPLVSLAILCALSLTSPAFIPALVTADDKLGLVVPAVAIGLIVPFFEEMGWTGFAIPELRKRHGILSTGLVVGLLWGLWHLPLFSAAASSSTLIAPGLYLAVLLFSWLPPYRVLMVWVYDHTNSVLVAMLMHLPIVVNSLVLIPMAPPEAVLTYDLAFAATLWGIVAIVAVANRGHLSRQTEQSLVEESSLIGQERTAA